ncbi:ribonuclease H-like domain-containing protein [Tanacetum coccineum]
MPVLQKDDYDTWAMEMEHYLEYIDNEVWKVIQNGNSKKRVTKGKDGVYRVLPPTTQEEQTFSWHGDAKEIWAAIRQGLVENANSKKMQKAVLKQQFEAFTISSKESLEKGYDRFQKLLSQLDALGAGVSDEDANHKFLRSLPPAWDSLAMTMRTKKNIDTLSIDDLYNNLSIAMTAIKIKKFYKKTGRRPRVDGKMHVAFDKRKVECFNCHNTGHFARECKFKGTKDGSRQEASRGQDFKPVRTEKEALMTIDEGQINWVEQTTDEELNHALMAFTVNNEVLDMAYNQMLRSKVMREEMVQSDGEPGTVSDHSVNDDPVSTQKTQPKVPTPTQTVDPSCAQHVKPPRQPIKTPVTSSPIPSYKRQNWNQRMERELGAGYSFERKSCFVCGSLSHLLKDCGLYEEKDGHRGAVLKSKRVVHTNDRQATPAWNNTNRINKANQFNPRPVNVRPNLSTASNTFKTGRVNVNTGHGNINSGSVHVNAGTQIKSGASRFNTGKQHVNSDRMYVNSGTQNKSGGSRVNTGKQNVNTARVNRPVLSNQTSQVNLKSPKKCFSKQSSPVNRPFSRNTAYESNKYAVKGKMGTAVKTSAGCVWRKTTPHSNTNGGPTPDSNVHVSQGPQGRPKPVKGWVTRETNLFLAHLEDYQDLSKVGSVTFGGSKGSISGKDIDIPHQYLYSRLLSLIVSLYSRLLSSDFKMPDETQVLLKVPRQHNMYTFDMNNVASSKGYTCLLAKASSDEAKLWHRRLSHLNFKNLNKLVKDNLVRGLPSKSFKNDQD